MRVCACVRACVCMCVCVCVCVLGRNGSGGLTEVAETVKFVATKRKWPQETVPLYLPTPTKLNSCLFIYFQCGGRKGNSSNNSVGENLPWQPTFLGVSHG